MSRVYDVIKVTSLVGERVKQVAECDVLPLADGLEPTVLSVLVESSLKRVISLNKGYIL